MTQKPLISLVIPAYNEAKRLPPTLQAYCAFLTEQDWPFEIIVSDDGSTDDTRQAVEALSLGGVRVIGKPSNRGKGFAVKQGVQAAQGAWILIADADGATPITELPKLFALGGPDVPIVIGTRTNPKLIAPKQPFFRQITGKTYNALVRAMTGLPYRDTQCGFKLIEAQIARAIFAQMQVAGFGFDVELLYLAQQNGLAVAQIDVVWRNDPDSRVQLVRDSWRMWLEIQALQRYHGSLVQPRQLLRIPDEPVAQGVG